MRAEFPGDNPLQNSKKSVSTENEAKLQFCVSRSFSLLLNATDSGFNHIGVSGLELGSMRENRMPVNVPQPGAPESDVPAFSVPGKEECVHSPSAKTTLRTRNTKQPEIEVVCIPTKFDPDDMRGVVDILADWIIADIEKDLNR